jgi:protein O-mannosyl-transferase
VPGALEGLGEFSSRDPRLVARSRAILRSPLTLGLLLVGLALVVYARAVRFGFVNFDDPRYVSENFHVLSGLNLSSIRWAFSTLHDCNWIPLTWLSLMLDSTLYGRWAGGFHATNILLHVGNVLLVFLFFSWATGQTLRSAMVAALFAIHPLHVESVVWVSERKDVLSMFFGLVSLCAYVRYARGHRIAWLAISLVSFCASLAAKQTFVTLPFVLLLLDAWPLERIAVSDRRQGDQSGAQNRGRRLAWLVVEKIPYFAVSAAFCAVVLFAQRGAARSADELPLSMRVLNAILAYGLYLEKTVVPFDLAIFYPHPGTAIALAPVALSCAVLAAITLFAIATRRRWPFVTVGWLWFLGTLVPMIGLVQVGLQQRADRYTYFPNLGLYLAVCWLVPAVVPGFLARWRVLPACAAAVVAVYAGIAFLQVGYWRDGIVLMRHVLAVTDDSVFTRTVMGDAYFAESRIEEALPHYRRVVDLAPRDANSYVTLGMAYYHLNRFDSAIEQFQTAIKLNDRFAGGHCGLALALCGQEKYIEARREFHKALAIDEQNPGAYAGLALMCRILGEIPQSIAYAERAIELDNDGLFSQRLMAVKLFDQGRLDEAIDRWRQLVAVEPGNKDIRAELRRAEAVKRSRDAVRQ